MSLIEQAAKRLEELRRAGAETGGADSQPVSTGMPSHADVRHVPTPEAAIRDLNGRAAGMIAHPRPDDGGVATVEPHRPARVVQPSLDINLDRLKMRGFVTPDAPKSQIAEEYRVVKRPIVQNAANSKIKNGNLVMVTSSLPGEGKTFTTVNLAMSLAMEVDTTVLLVDGDVAHPDLPNILGVPRSPGLLDLLTREDYDVGSVLVRTNVKNLSIIPAGSPHRRATELLASDQMTRLLADLASHYSDRIIVFDSPPLLATTEARVLATYMGQVIMVVAADSTRHTAVTLALSTIEKCEVVFMMLNKAQRSDVGTYYDYYADETPR